MIKQPGKVIVDENGISITQFVFDGINGENFQREVLLWALDRIVKELQKEEVRKKLVVGIDIDRETGYSRVKYPESYVGRISGVEIKWSDTA